MKCAVLISSAVDKQNGSDRDLVFVFVDSPLNLVSWMSSLLVLACGASGAGLSAHSFVDAAREPGVLGCVRDSSRPGWASLCFQGVQFLTGSSLQCHRALVPDIRR